MHFLLPILQLNAQNKYVACNHSPIDIYAEFFNNISNNLSIRNPHIFAYLQQKILPIIIEPLKEYRDNKKVDVVPCALYVLYMYSTLTV